MLPLPPAPNRDPPQRHLPLHCSHHPTHTPRPALHFHIGSQTCDLTLYGPPCWVLILSSGATLEEFRALPHQQPITLRHTLAESPMSSKMHSPPRCYRLKCVSCKLLACQEPPPVLTSSPEPRASSGKQGWGWGVCRKSQKENKDGE